MADLQKLLFESRARISDREVLATARLTARVKAFAGQEITDDMTATINAAVVEEIDRLIAEGILQARPDWLVALVGRRLHAAFGTDAVQKLSRELQEMRAP